MKRRVEGTFCTPRGVALLLIGALAMLTACSPLAVLNAFAPQDDHDFHTAAYGPDPRQRLDVYTPLAAGGSAPVVVFFYGGTWRGGERADYRFVGQALASRGIVAVVADYRVYPQVRYPDFVRDSAQAVAWTLRTIAQYGGDPGRVYVMGHSAGAYNAAMVALDPRWLAEWGMAPASLVGWIGLAGPYDFLPIQSDGVKPVFDAPDTLADSQPIAHVRQPSPPALLLVSANDRLVDPQRNTVGLAARMRNAGIPVIVRSFDGINHFLLIGALAKPLRGLAPVLDSVTAFVAPAP